MASAGMLEVQKALIATLRTAVTQVSSRVYDMPPQAVLFPFLRVYQVRGQAYDGTIMDGWEAFFRVEAWSRKAGQMVEAQQIGAAAYEALHNRSLTLDTRRFVNGRLEAERLMRDTDGVTVSLLQDYRFVTLA